MKLYTVDLRIRNSIQVKAENEEAASQEVLDMGIWDHLDGAEYDVTEVVEETLNIEEETTA